MIHAKKIIQYFVALIVFPVAISFSVFVWQEARVLYQSDMDAIHSLTLNEFKSPFGPDSPAKKAYRGEGPIPDDMGFFMEEIQTGVLVNTPSVHYIYKTPAQVTNVIIDPMGFRVGEPRGAVEKIDILVIGASQTWGHGLKYNETFSAIVAKRLGMTLGNAAIPGSNAVQSLLGMDHYLSLKPKYILFGIHEDMIYSNLERAGHRPLLGMSEDPVGFYIRPGGTTIYKNNYIPAPMQWAAKFAGNSGIYELFVNAFFFRLKYQLQLLRNLFFTSEPGENISFLFNAAKRPEKNDPLLFPIANDGMAFILTKMKKKADAIGAHLIVVSSPYVNGENTPTPKAWTRAAKEQGFTFVDLRPLLYQYNRDDWINKIIIPNDGHLNAKANSLIAEQVFKTFERLEKNRQPIR